MKTTYRLFSALFIISTFFACKEKKEPIAQTPVQQAPVEEIKKVDTVKAPVKPVKPVIKETPHYFLIAGCFEYMENAQKLCAKLQKEGYPEAKVLPYYENLYLVAYEGYAKKADATKALATMKKETHKKGTWLHHVK